MSNSIQEQLRFSGPITFRVGRARGGAILGAAGTVATVSVEVPMLESIGPIKPGALVEITEGPDAF